MAGRQRRGRGAPRSSTERADTGPTAPEAALSNSRVAELVSNSSENPSSSMLDKALQAIVDGSLANARTTAQSAAEEARSTGDFDTADTAGVIWQVSSALSETQQALGSRDWSAAMESAHTAAEHGRTLRDLNISDDLTGQIIAAAGGYWTQANQAKEAEAQPEEERGEAGPYAVWTTGGGSSLLPTGDWGADDLRTHHSDRTHSWAADRVREGRDIAYDSVAAYDLTFEKLDANGDAVAGSARGLPLMAPVASKVYDIQTTYEGSGGYGRFIILEYLEGELAGQRVQVSHLHTVEPLGKGTILDGGEVFGTQGGSGSRGPDDYAVHVDIVGTADAVILFTKSNQSGTFETTTRSQGV